MKVAVVGGRLQGVEASYLALLLGWKVLLVDRDSKVPAKGLCHSFYQCDVVRQAAKLHKILKQVDLIIPALENVSALRSLDQSAELMNIPLAFDKKAYLLSRSKKRSNELFQRLGIPIPRPWPRCGFPVIVKPSFSSGSEGVKKLNTEEEFYQFFKSPDVSDRWVIQEYLKGRSFSLEVFGLKGHYEVAQVTELEMDKQYDCKRVLVPAKISPTLTNQFEEISLKIAKSLYLTGIMDVEVISHEGTLKVLEIDARLPSQTPTAVFKSTGVNMLGILADIFVGGVLPPCSPFKQVKGVVYEHIRVSDEGVNILGEHIMADAGPLKSVEGFLGANEAITDFHSSKSQWVATLMFVEETRKKAWLKGREAVDRIGRLRGVSFNFEKA